MQTPQEYSYDTFTLELYRAQAKLLSTSHPDERVRCSARTYLRTTEIVLEADLITQHNTYAAESFTTAVTVSEAAAIIETELHNSAISAGEVVKLLISAGTFKEVSNGVGNSKVVLSDGSSRDATSFLDRLLHQVFYNRTYLEDVRIFEDVYKVRKTLAEGVIPSDCVAFTLQHAQYLESELLSMVSSHVGELDVLEFDGLYTVCDTEDMYYARLSYIVPPLHPDDDMNTYLKGRETGILFELSDCTLFLRIPVTEFSEPKTPDPSLLGTDSVEIEAFNALVPFSEGSYNGFVLLRVGTGIPEYERSECEGRCDLPWNSAPYEVLRRVPRTPLSDISMPDAYTNKFARIKR